eukprot:TRINITY_DN1809_c0_g1_i4.p2 TRINITY_DN1809_c0_g1~~TRINITY_DN1809_c0_g1_i4.p2  ORF type:complete len:196 (+),score=-6.11 TRINITY_DN1809_c0_g1_i4:511-1098(+)
MKYQQFICMQLCIKESHFFSDYFLIIVNTFANNMFCQLFERNLFAIQEISILVLTQKNNIIGYANFYCIKQCTQSKIILYDFSNFYFINYIFGKQIRNKIDANFINYKLQTKIKTKMMQTYLIFLLPQSSVFNHQMAVLLKMLLVQILLIQLKKWNKVDEKDLIQLLLNLMDMQERGQVPPPETLQFHFMLKQQS